MQKHAVCSLVMVAALSGCTQPLDVEDSAESVLEIAPCGAVGGFPPLNFFVQNFNVFKTAAMTDKRVSKQDARSVRVTGLTLTLVSGPPADLSMFRRVAVGAQAGMGQQGAVIKVAELTGFTPTQLTADLTPTHADISSVAKDASGVTFMTEVEMDHCLPEAVTMKAKVSWVVEAQPDTVIRWLTL